MTHKTEILFQRKVGDLFLFNYLGTSSQHEPYAQIHSKHQGLFQGCVPQRQRENWCFAPKADEVLSVGSFPCCVIPATAQLFNCSWTTPQDWSYRLMIKRINLFQSLSCFAFHRYLITVSQKELLHIFTFHVHMSSASCELIHIPAESFCWIHQFQEGSILYSENCNGSTKNIFNFIMCDLFNWELRQLFLA